MHLLGCSGVHPDPELSRIFCVDQLFADFLINFRRFFARIYVIYVTFELRDSELSCISKYHEQQYDCILWAIFLTKYLHCKNAIKFVLEGGGSYKGATKKIVSVPHYLKGKGSKLNFFSKLYLITIFG